MHIHVLFDFSKKDTRQKHISRGADGPNFSFMAPSIKEQKVHKR